MKPYNRFNAQYLLLAGIILLFIMHIPFLKADPDNMSVGRDALTDEGLNSCQLRNFINYGTIKMDECDNLIKGPLFAAIYFLPFKIFGIHSSTARLTLLIFSFLVITFLWFRSHDFINFFIIGIVLMNYYIFKYMHYALAEGLCISFVFAGSYFTRQSLLTVISSRRRIINNILASILFAAAYYTRFIFLSAAAIPLAALILDYFLIKDDDKLLHGKLLLSAIAVPLIFAAAYGIFWILPRYDIFIYIYKHQSAGLDLSARGLYRVLQHTLGILKMPDFTVPALLFSVTLIPAIYLFLKKADIRFRKYFLVLTAWFLFEVPKLTMSYLPSRYLANLFFVMLLMSALVLKTLYDEKKISAYRPLIAASVLLMVSINLYSYCRTFSRREFVISQWNEYFSKYDLRNRKVIGAWAPALTWDSKAYIYPVWYDFMNDKDIARQKPAVIISEPGEYESMNAYKLNNVNLERDADSILKTNIGGWDVNIYWMNYDVKKEK